MSFSFMPAKVVLACAVLWRIMDLSLQLVFDGRRKAGIEIF